MFFIENQTGYASFKLGRYPAFYIQKEQFLIVDFTKKKIYNFLE